MDPIDNDYGYSTPGEGSENETGSPTGIPSFRERPVGSLHHEDVLEISSSSSDDDDDYGMAQVYGNSVDNGVGESASEEIPVTRSAETSVAGSISRDYGEGGTFLRLSVPEVTSVTRMSYTTENADVSEGHDRLSTTRASFATAASASTGSAKISGANSRASVTERMSTASASNSAPLRASSTGINTGNPASEYPGHVDAQRLSAVNASTAQRKQIAALKRPPIKPAVVLSPARIIAEFKRGSMNKQQAVESLIRYRMNKMLHKNSDRMYVDKDGDVRFVKGYDFGKARDARGRIIKRNGFTRIEREILAYQKSTHLLIPRTIFARIVREIAQNWWKGPEPVKFTVEALSALQAATEDEITRLLEISTACSYHAKRITLRIDDMRLARFCRGRQEYEFFNIKS